MSGPRAQWFLEVAVPESKRSLIKPLVILILVAGLAVAGYLWMRSVRRPSQTLASGTLEARTVNVGSLYGGRVAAVLVDEGSSVAAGQTLIRLETDTIDHQIAEQKSAIESARAQLAKGLAGARPVEISKAAVVAANDEREHQRIASLYRAGIVAKQMLDDAATRAKASADDLRLLQEGTRKEDLDALRAALDQQQRRLDTLLRQRVETDVRSSVAGVVQSFALRPGDLVAPNQPVAEILEAGQLWARIYVPETDLGLVHVGQQVRLRIDTAPHVWFSGKVGSVSSKGEYTPRNIQTRDQRAEEVFAVRVFVDPDPRLKPGMSADVDLSAPQGKS